MHERPRAQIVNVGDELTSGEVTDTNGPVMAAWLREVGIELVSLQSIRDRKEEIVEALRRAVSTAKFVLVSGGLGPTEDDRTREAIAAVAGVELVEHPEIRQKLLDFFARMGRKPLEATFRQAFFPAGATVMENPVGSAAPFAVNVADSVIIAMPGVPNELRTVFAGAVRGLIQRITDGVKLEAAFDIYKAYGISESEVNEKLVDLIVEGSNPEVRLTVHDGEVWIHVSAHGKGARELSSATGRVVASRIGEFLFGQNDDTLPKAVASLLTENGLKLSVAESCTGGLVGHLLTDVPGVSASFLADVVAYSNEAKTDLLGVDAKLIAREGAVSEAVALAMAQGIRQRSKSDFAVSVTGIAGPSGGTPQKPVGLVYIGVATPQGSTAHKLQMRPPRELIKFRSAMTALNLLRKAILKHIQE